MDNLDIMEIFANICQTTLFDSRLVSHGEKKISCLVHVLQESISFDKQNSSNTVKQSQVRSMKRKVGLCFFVLY